MAVGGSPSATHSSAHACLIEGGRTCTLQPLAATLSQVEAEQRRASDLESFYKQRAGGQVGAPTLCLPLASSGLASALATRSPALKPAGQPTHLAD